MIFYFLHDENVTCTIVYHEHKMSHFNSYTEYSSAEDPYLSWLQGRRDVVFACYWETELRMLQAIIEIGSQLYFALELKTVNNSNYLLVAKINMINRVWVELGSVRLKSIHDINDEPTPYFELDEWEDIATNVTFPLHDIQDTFFNSFLGPRSHVRVDAMALPLNDSLYNDAIVKFYEAVAYSATIDSIQSGNIFILFLEM